MGVDVMVIGMVIANYVPLCAVIIELCKSLIYLIILILYILNNASFQASDLIWFVYNADLFRLGKCENGIELN